MSEAADAAGDADRVPTTAILRIWPELHRVRDDVPVGALLYCETMDVVVSHRMTFTGMDGRLWRLGLVVDQGPGTAIRRGSTLSRPAEALRRVKRLGGQ